MTNFKKINQETYNSISKNWETKRDYFWETVVEFVDSFENKENLNYLDLGCGSGRNLELAVELKYKKENLLGVDFSEELLNIVKNKGFKTQQNDLEHLTLEDNSQDVIVCIAVHHHLLEKEQQLTSLKEMRRVLKSNGKLLLANWFPQKEFIEKSVKKKKFIFIEEQVVQVYYEFEKVKYDRFYYLFKEEEIINLAQEAGFKVEKQEHSKGNFYLTLI
jgi:ubiquinone/menaquinone biosynthesis C-methylase UbiE